MTIVLIAALAAGGGVRSGTAGARSPDVGDVVFTDTVRRPAKDCGARRQVRAFQNRLRPRRSALPASSGSTAGSARGESVEARQGGCSPPRRTGTR